MAVLGIMGWYGLNAVKEELKKNLSSQLQVTLSSNITALKFWIKDRQQDVEVLAAEPGVRKNILNLLEQTRDEYVSAERLKQSDELIWLRENLGAACRKYGFIGFVLLDPTGYQVGALLEEPVGKRSLAESTDFFYRSMQGDTVVSLPFPGEVVLPDIHGVWRSGWPTMFVSTPIRELDGEVAGVLSFRLRPETEFTQMLEISRWGKTGETYAFNNQGVLITGTRFNDQLKRVGLLTDRAGIHSILNVEARNPGGNLVKGHRPTLPRKRQPFTEMAASALRGERGVNVDGYNDYRGVPVIGAWTWLPDYHFGITTEIHVAEAFATLHAMSRGFLMIFGLLVLASGTAFLMRRRQIGLSRERNIAQEKVRENAIRMDAVMNSVVDGIITIDENGSIETFNRSAESLFGYSKSEVLGKNVKLLMPEPWHNRHDGYINHYVKTGRAKIIGVGREVTGLRKDGKTFPMELAISEVLLEGRRLFTGIVRNISERKQTEQELNRAKIEAESANRSKSTFLVNMSHEIRSPMNAILGFSQILMNDPALNPHQIQSVETIKKSGENLLELINDILDLSKIEAGRMEIILTHFDLNCLVQNLSSLFKLEIQKKNLKWNLQGLPDSPVQIHGDETKLRQVLTNLVGNAVKFTESGEVGLKVTAETNHRFRFEVFDTGPGILPDAQKFIFEPFRQEEQGARRGGTGLGLAICRQHVALMGGKLSLESEPGTGSRFFFTVPLPPAGEANENQPNPYESSHPPRQEENETNGLNAAHFNIPHALLSRLKAGAEVNNITELERSLKELCQMGQDGRALERHLKEHIDNYQIEKVLEILGRIEHAP